MTAQIIPFPSHPLETRINAHLQLKNLPYAARFVPAPDPTVDDELQFTHNGTPTTLTVQICHFEDNPELSGGGSYIAIMENSPPNERVWVRMHGDFRLDHAPAMASFFTKLTVLLKKHAA